MGKLCIALYKASINLRLRLWCRR